MRYWIQIRIKVKSWIRIRIKVKIWIRIRIKVIRIRNPDLQYSKINAYRRTEYLWRRER